MKKIFAFVLSLALAFPTASLLAQQAPAQQQPAQVAQAGGPPPAGLFGLGLGATVALGALLVIVVANAVDDDDTIIPATATDGGTTGTR